MTRKATDLLDVFRAERTPPPRSGGAAPRGAGREGSEAGVRRTFEGLFLHPRQLLMGSCVVLLLLVFTFVLGLSVGRRGKEPAAPGAALARTAELETSEQLGLYVVGRVPYMDKRGLKPNDPETMVKDLGRFRGVEREQIWISDEKASQSWVVILGPFADERRAREYLGSHNLTRALLGGVYPFERPDFRPLPARVLPAQRVPSR